jgi:putative ABC transport system ATP-binding protein
VSSNNQAFSMTQSLPEPLVRLRGVTKQHVVGERPFTALHGIDLDVRAGECVAVIGKSGSGKTTLIHLLTGIDGATSGEIVVGARALHGLSQRALTAWRGRHVGLVFQSPQLLPTLTVAENVTLPMDFLAALPARARRPRALALLDRLGIADQADKLPAALSGGQQQRAAIARALANDPPIVVADEPTGNLDSATADDVMALLASLARDGKTVLTATHERELQRFFTRTVTLRDGRVVGDTTHPYRATIAQACAHEALA